MTDASCHTIVADWHESSMTLTQPNGGTTVEVEGELVVRRGDLEEILT